MAGANTVTITDASFDSDVLRSDVPVLVDFWAEWCPPCKQLAPLIDILAWEYSGRLKVGKLDVSSNTDTANRYNVHGIPSLLLFKGGAVVAQQVGVVGKPELKKMIDRHVGAPAV